MVTRRYYSLDELVTATSPYGVRRSRLYSRFLSPTKRQRMRVAYTERGHLRIPREAGDKIIAQVRTEFDHSPVSASAVRTNLRPYSPCTTAGCDKKSNRKDGLCRMCAKKFSRE